MTQQPRFLTALKALQDWHADSVQARDYNAAATSSSSKPGAVHFRANRYPSTRYWLQKWAGASPETQESLVTAIEAELAGLSKGPRLAVYHDHWGQQLWRRKTT